jgi:hypothetical protein
MCTSYAYASCYSASWSCICRTAIGTRPPRPKPAAMKEDQITPFQRCHHEPCTFTHFLDGQTDANGAPKRIICSVYVDDGAAHVG